MPLRTRRDAASYQDYLAQQHRDEERQNADEQRRADEAARPLREAQAAFEQTARAEAEATRERILTQRCDDLLPAELERINGHEVDATVAASNYRYWAKSTPTFRCEFSELFLRILEINDLAPIARNFQPLHELLLEYSCYELPKQPAQPAPSAQRSEHQEPTYAERSSQARHDYMTKVVIVHDGVKYTEKMLDDMPAKQALHIRRISERGHSGGAAYQEWLNTQNEIEKRQREVARMAAEEIGGQ